MTETTPQPIDDTGCCPRFDPTPWDGTEIEMHDRLFVKDRVRSILHIPLNFGRVMVRNMAKIDRAGARGPEMLLLCDENSLWGADVYIAVTEEVPGAEHARLSGRFLTKAFEGPFKDIRKWVKQMGEYVAARNETLKRMLFYYTTCPKCAKAYGKNYVVLLGEV